MLYFCRQNCFFVTASAACRIPFSDVVGLTRYHKQKVCKQLRSRSTCKPEAAHKLEGVDQLSRSIAEHKCIQLAASSQRTALHPSNSKEKLLQVESFPEYELFKCFQSSQKSHMLGSFQRLAGGHYTLSHLIWAFVL